MCVLVLYQNPEIESVAVVAVDFDGSASAVLGSLVGDGTMKWEHAAVRLWKNQTTGIENCLYAKIPSYLPADRRLLYEDLNKTRNTKVKQYP